MERKRKVAKPMRIADVAKMEALEASLFGGGREENETEDMHMHKTTEYEGAKWEDLDDEKLHVNISSKSRLRKLRKSEEEEKISGREFEERLREQYTKLNAKTSWVSKLGSQKEQRDILQVAGGLLGSSKRLPPGDIETTKLQDANQSEPSKSVVNSVEFHPNGQLLLTASLDRRMRFFSVDGLKNPHVQTVFFEDMPIHKAQFVEQGTKIICTGRRSFFYFLDLETSKMERISKIFGRDEKSFESCIASNDSHVAAFIGQDGALPLVSLSSRQLIDTLKMNGSARAGSFSEDGQMLYTSGGDGIVYTWDMRMRKCLDQFVDEGNLCGTSFAVSPAGNLLASGSKSGVVNIYSKTSFKKSSSESVGAKILSPLKSLPHLTTTVDSMTFNSDGQILAIASRLRKDSLRLIHIPTMTAFSNWPTSKSPLHYVHSVGFSPSSGYLAIGNARGKVILYRLHFYPQTN